MPADGVTSLCHSDILSLEVIERVVRVAATMGIKRFRLTGGEPLVRKGAVDLVRAIHETPGVDDVSLTTNWRASAEVRRRARVGGPFAREYFA